MKGYQSQQGRATETREWSQLAKVEPQPNVNIQAAA